MFRFLRKIDIITPVFHAVKDRIEVLAWLFGIAAVIVIIVLAFVEAIRELTLGWQVLFYCGVFALIYVATSKILLPVTESWYSRRFPKPKTAHELFLEEHSGWVRRIIAEQTVDLARYTKVSNFVVDLSLIGADLATIIRLQSSSLE